MSMDLYSPGQIGTYGPGPYITFPTVSPLVFRGNPGEAFNDGIALVVPWDGVSWNTLILASGYPLFPDLPNVKQLLIGVNITWQGTFLACGVAVSEFGPLVNSPGGVVSTSGILFPSAYRLMVTSSNSFGVVTSLPPIPATVAGAGNKPKPPIAGENALFGGRNMDVLFNTTFTAGNPIQYSIAPNYPSGTRISYIESFPIISWTTPTVPSFSNAPRGSQGGLLVEIPVGTFSLYLSRLEVYW